MQAQIEPDKSFDNYKLLFKYINLKSPENRNLLLIYLVTCLVPDIPHPIPVFYGEKGAAKSTALRVLRRLIDPSGHELTTLSGKPNDFALKLSRNYMPCFDNLDYIRPWQSDMLCQASTGGGISKRELFTNTDEVIINFKDCPVINGINQVVTRTDLLDRAILFQLERISAECRKEEKEFWQEFEKDRPQILGGLFTALAGAMKVYPNTKLKHHSRMADFCHWGYAIAESIGIGGDAFLSTYEESIVNANKEAIITNPVAEAIVSFMAKKNNWEGPTAKLLEELTLLAESHHIIESKSKMWPSTINVLVRRLNSNLAGVGISFEVSRDSENKSQIVLRNSNPMATNSSGDSGHTGGIKAQKKEGVECF